MNLIGTLGSWWGYAEADATIVGILVIAIAVLAVAYVATRIARNRRPAAASLPEHRGRASKHRG